MKTLTERLLDTSDTGAIEFTNENGEKVLLEQIAVIPYEDELYAILAPSELIGNNDPNIAVVYRIEGDNAKIVEDDDTIDVIFELYDRLFAEGSNSGN